MTAPNPGLVPLRRVVSGKYTETPASARDGEHVPVSVDALGRLKIYGYNLRPAAGKGQAIAYGGTSTRTHPLTIGAPHIFFSSTICWINIGDSSVIAAAGDFPIPPGAVWEYIPLSINDQYIAIIQHDTVGTFFLGQSANVL